MEDCIDDFVHRVEMEHQETPQGVGVFGFFNNCISKLKKLGSRSEIANHIQELESLTAEASERRARYSLSDGDATLVPTPAAIDPRLPAFFVEESRLVGVDGPRDEVVRFLLMEGPADCLPRHQVVAMVGFGGCGKTTLAKPGVQQNKVPI
jgi:disease resistance protein RPM1